MKICYFGDYDPQYSRNRVILKGLRQNDVQVVEVRTPQLQGLSRFWKLYRGYQVHGKDADYLIVGMSDTSRLLTIFATWFAQQPVIWDAFYSLYDSWIFDRRLASSWSIKAAYYWLVEYIACHTVDTVLLDTQTHIEYFVKTFRVSKEKFVRVFVGTDDEVFTQVGEPEEKDSISVEFHGTYIPLQGIEYIVRAAKLLESHSHIRFTLVGNGQEFSSISKLARDIQVSNITFVDRVSYDTLPQYIRDADICLGIFGTSDKAARVIPNKIYEALAVGRPIITADTPAIRELCTPLENIILCQRSDAQSLADSIVLLANNPTLRHTVATAGRELFERKCTPRIITQKLLQSL